MAEATDNLKEAEKIIKKIIYVSNVEEALEICRWLMSFNDIEKNHRIKCYKTGGNKPDFRFCIDRGYDCSGPKIMTNFLVIEPDHTLMGLYSVNPHDYPYFKPDQRRWRIASNDVKKLPMPTIREHILESYCIKIKDLGLTSDVCKRGKSISIVNISNNQEDTSTILCLPTKADIDSALTQLRRKSTDDEIGEAAVLDQVEVNYNNAGKVLKPNWREITTRRNLAIWFGKEKQ